MFTKYRLKTPLSVGVNIKVFFFYIFVSVKVDIISHAMVNGFYDKNMCLKMVYDCA